MALSYARLCDSVNWFQATLLEPFPRKPCHQLIDWFQATQYFWSRFSGKPCIQLITCASGDETGPSGIKCRITCIRGFQEAALTYETELAKQQTGRVSTAWLWRSRHAYLNLCFCRLCSNQQRARASYSSYKASPVQFISLVVCSESC